MHLLPGSRILLRGAGAQGAGKGVGIEHEVVGVHGGQEPERVAAPSVLREGGDDRVVGALVGEGDGVEERAGVGGAAEARVRGEERVVGEGVGVGYPVKHPACVAEAAEPRVRGNEGVEEEGLRRKGRLEGARVSGAGGGEGGRGAEEVGERRRGAEVGDEVAVVVVSRHANRRVRSGADHPQAPASVFKIQAQQVLFLRLIQVH